MLNVEKILSIARYALYYKDVDYNI